MGALSEIRNQNIFLSIAGANFINPLFRLLSAQLPANVNKYTIYGHSDEERERKFKKLLKKEKDCFVLILRDSNADLEEVLYIPSEKCLVKQDIAQDAAL